MRNCPSGKDSSIFVSSITRMSILLEIISARDENLFGSEFRLRVATTTLSQFFARYSDIRVFASLVQSSSAVFCNNSRFSLSSITGVNIGFGAHKALV